MIIRQSEFCFEHTRLAPASVLDKAMMDAEVWRETMAPSTALEAPLAPASIDEVRWLRPPPNWLKCNVASLGPLMRH